MNRYYPAVVLILLPAIALLVGVCRNSVNDIEPHLLVDIPKQQLRMGDTFGFEARIVHNADIAGWSVDVQDDMNYFVRRKAHFQATNATVHVSLPTRSRFVSSIAELPTALKVTLKDQRNKPVLVKDVDFPMNLYGSMLESSFWPSGPSDVLLVGFPGVGKSTFCMSAISALADSIVPVATYGDVQHHLTQQIIRYDISDFVDNNKIQIRLWDTWGMTAQNFNRDFLNNLLTGNVPNSYRREQYKDHYHGDAPISHQPLPGMHAMTSALFFLKATQAQDRYLLQQLKAMLEVPKELDVHPLIIVTFLDYCSPEEQNEVLGQIARSLSLPTGHVLPFYGYHDHLLNMKNSTIDKNVLEILQMVVRSSENFHRSQRVRVEKAEKEIELYLKEYENKNARKKASRE